MKQGFLTYDRAVWKMDAARVRTANLNLIRAYGVGARYGSLSSVPS